MIAMPMHPSNVFTIDDLNANLDDILNEIEVNCNKQLDNNAVKVSLRDKVVNGRLTVEQ